MEKIIHEEISLNISDGTSMSAYAARPEVKGKFPGVLVFQEAFGVNSHTGSVDSIVSRYNRPLCP